MPVDSEVVLNIVCDNSACPGNSLPTDDRTGWTFITAEVYGEPGAQYVYCSPECASTVGDKLAAAQAEEPAPAP